MKISINKKRSFSIVACTLFAFGLFFNTSINHAKANIASLSLINLETAYAQEEGDIQNCQVCTYTYECEIIEVIPGVFDTVCYWEEFCIDVICR